jgi:acyl dehydratase
MPLDQSFVGHKFEPTAPYRVGREKILEFADAIGAPDPAYRDPAAARGLGYPDVIAPPTFPVVFSMGVHQSLIDLRGLGLDFSRVVHADQRFVYTRPVHAGDQLVCLSWIETIMARGGHDFITTRTEVVTDESEPVVTFWCRLVVRGEGGSADE